MVASTYAEARLTVPFHQSGLNQSVLLMMTRNTIINTSIQ